MISFDEAYSLTRQAIRPLGAETIALLAATGRVAAADLAARLDSPAADVSLKDGYAVRGAEVRLASPEAPVRLRLVGSVAAGESWPGNVNAGEAVRILSGAALPHGADAVVSEEFTRTESGFVSVVAHAQPGRNVLARGGDVQNGRMLVRCGEQFSPEVIGLLAAAGYAEAPVVRRPRVSILSTGDEITLPGRPLTDGKLYSSNLYTLAAWCLRCGFEVETRIAPDDARQIHSMLAACLGQSDAVITSGGAWKGEHDLTVRILDEIGWQKRYHRVRIGPGKAVGFGVYENKPIFCLPGGPPSNHMAFLQLALPGLQRLAGAAAPGLPCCPVTLAETISGQLDWTQFVCGRLIQEGPRLLFQPIKGASRLQMLAQTQAIATISEGRTEVLAGASLMVQVLDAAGVSWT